MKDYNTLIIELKKIRDTNKIEFINKLESAIVQFLDKSCYIKYDDYLGCYHANYNNNKNIIDICDGYDGREYYVDEVIY